MVCDNCPLRLFNDKGYNLKGIGESCYGNMAILPNIDKDAYKNNDVSFSKQLEIINDVLQVNLSTGVLQDTFYVTPLIKCREHSKCIVDTQIIYNCQNHLMNEIRMYNPRHIMMFGSSVRRLVDKPIESLIGKLLVSRNNRIYYFNYNPFIVFTDVEKQQIFTNELIKAFYSITNKDYTSYEIYKI